MIYSTGHETSWATVNMSATKATLGITSMSKPGTSQASTRSVTPCTSDTLIAHRTNRTKLRSLSCTTCTSHLASVTLPKLRVTRRDSYRRLAHVSRLFQEGNRLWSASPEHQ